MSIIPSVMGMSPSMTIVEVGRTPFRTIMVSIVTAQFSIVDEVIFSGFIRSSIVAGVLVAWIFLFAA